MRSSSMALAPPTSATAPRSRRSLLGYSARCLTAPWTSSRRRPGWPSCAPPIAHFQGLSFDTISGAGANGAIVHYHATPATNRVLEPHSLYLVDSGGQYLDGTTDVTRTVAIGSPLPEHRDRFTRVLKGHIAIATCRFPAGTSGIAARHARAPAPVAGRARLRPRHGSRRRQLSVRSRGSAAEYRRSPIEWRSSRGMVVSNEPRLLQGRRLRHPYRKPGRGCRGRIPRRRREEDAEIRDP